MHSIIGCRIISLQNTASTNIFALEQASVSRPEEGTVVITHDQTEGRGMDHNSWESEPGKNLTFSIILYPSFLPAEKQFSLSMAVVLGIMDMICTVTGLKDVRVKWPNDVYIGNRKVCGILIQNSVTGRHLDFSIIGIGLNINQTKFLPETPNPVSLKNILHREFDLDEMFAQLCSSLDNRYTLLMNGKYSQIEHDYLKNLYRKGELHSYAIRGQVVNAVIQGITKYGQLLLRDETGNEYTCDVKEVKYL